MILALPRPYRLPALLGAAMAILAGVLALEWQLVAHDLHTLRAEVAMPAAEGPDLQPPDAVLLERQTLENYDEMVKRPLFTKDRRPVADGEKGSADAEAATAEVEEELMGVIVMPDGRLALFRDRQGKYTRLRLDETLKGWRLVELGDEHAILESDTKRAELRLRRPLVTAPATTINKPLRQVQQRRSARRREPADTPGRAAQTGNAASAGTAADQPAAAAKSEEGASEAAESEEHIGETPEDPGNEAAGAATEQP